ncbi:MAG TPA: MoxR family ATPase [Armatimonadota bacterium]|nr:MoxR family ATPase [Armatimonadota bacterium]HPP74000.1 MoxR family ATPase [Armatimonadota bacterium]
MTTTGTNRISMRIEDAAERVREVIIGKEEVIRLVFASFLAGGHVLIEDVPGVGKTTLAKAVAKAIGCSFNRIQFTPDLLPSDVTGISIYSQKTGEFSFRPGPVFANVILADEINRATPKTQSALLECMEELQVTVDGSTLMLPKPFLVIATQNNIEHGSTYPLPEAQLDRFLIRVSVGYPAKEDEVAVLNRQILSHPINEISPVMSPEELASLQDEVKNIYIDDSLKDYIVDIVTATRNRRDVLLGASPRGSLALMRVSRALAAISGRDYVLPDDIKLAAVPTLGHRILVSHDTWQTDAGNQVIKEVLASIPVPVNYGRKQ